MDSVVELLHEFIRLNYVTEAEVARRMGVRDSTLYLWLQVTVDHRTRSGSRRF
jgi:transposase-like protein